MNVLRRTLLTSLGLAATGLSLPIFAADPKPAQYDAVIIGGGISGLAAAVEAVERGKKIALVQVQPILGGDAYLSTGWFYACGSPVQKRLSDVKDTPEQFVKDALAVAGGLRDPMWTKIVAEKAGSDIAWLEAHGVTFEDFITGAMGSPVPRAIQAKGYGRAVINALGKALAASGKADIILDTRATGLLVTDGKLIGIRTESNGKTADIHAASVVVATGGFPFNKELLQKFAPKFASMGAAGDPNLKGDGLEWLLDLGAQPRNIERLNIVPTTDVKTRIYLTSGALSGGGILVNEKGQRFCNELKDYTATALAMTEQKKVYEILVRETHSKVGVLADKEMISRADSISALAAALAVPEAALAEEIRLHNEATAGKIKDRFGRVVYKAPLKAPFYYWEVMPLVLQTLGGIITNDKTQVLGKDGKPLFPNLYATGDLISGYVDGGYRTGDALTFGLVSGRIAGASL